MNGLIVELLIGLYFIGLGLPGFASNPRSRALVFQVVFGVILTFLAIFHIDLISLRQVEEEGEIMDTFRKEYTPLDEVQKVEVKAIKEAAEALGEHFDSAIPRDQRSEKSRCMAIARTNLEQAVMWAVKAVTTKKEQLYANIVRLKGGEYMSKHKISNINERAGGIDGEEQPNTGVVEAAQTNPNPVPVTSRQDGDRPAGDHTEIQMDDEDTVKVSCITDTTVIQDFGIFPTNNDNSDNKTLNVPKALWEEYQEKKSNFKDVEKKLLNLWGQNGQ